MSLDRSMTVDAIGLEIEGEAVVLTIFDGWDWSDEHGHLLLLQAKLNAYFAFIETGQIYRDYPAAVSRPLRIDILGRHPMPASGLALLARARELTAPLGLQISSRHAPLAARRSKETC